MIRPVPVACGARGRVGGTPTKWGTRRALWVMSTCDLWSITGRMTTFEAQIRDFTGRGREDVPAHVLIAQSNPCAPCLYRKRGFNMLEDHPLGRAAYLYIRM